MYQRIILLISIVALVSATNTHKAAPFLFPTGTWNSTADAKAVVTCDSYARFTVLTSQLIRMELTPFSDEPTFAVLNRHLPVPAYTKVVDNNWMTLNTSAVTIHYHCGSGRFSDDSLNATFVLSPGVRGVWTPSMPDKGNLYGTIRTLDGALGWLNMNCTTNPDKDLHCSMGLISSDGWVILNDTATPHFQKRRTDFWWVKENIPAAGYLDYYLFAHGHNYKQALADYTKIGGQIPLPPKSLFGVWYSRYWAYDARGVLDVVDQYETHTLPLDIMVVDMDWHITNYKASKLGQKDDAGERPGWSGLTWDATLFPKPKAMIDSLHRKKIMTTLNLHPASGVLPYEECFNAMAMASGQDPNNKTYVPFKITDDVFTTNWFSKCLFLREYEGVDFWWLDWQQDHFTNMTNVNPTFMLNHAFFQPADLYDINAPHADWRKFIFHRWGGMGNHRYQIGFSGDVIPSWESLAFQVYFTSTASNVGYAYWSHDLGGHTRPVDGELYTRWVQWGAYSPIFRSHCTKDPVNDRRIWKYDDYYYEPMRNTIELRRQLIPFMYTLAKLTTDTGIGAHMPLYYNYPEYTEAYETATKTEFLLGDNMLVVPVTFPMDNNTKLATLNYWLPPGNWIEIDSGELHVGPARLTRYVALDETLVLVKQGTVYPVLPAFTHGQHTLGSAGYTDGKAYTELEWDIYPGQSQSGCGTNYDDDGITPAYVDNVSATTKTCYTYDRRSNFTVTITPEYHNFELPNRVHIIRIPHFLPPASIKDDKNNLIVHVADSAEYQSECRHVGQACWWYEANTLSLYVALAPTTTKTSVYINLGYPFKPELTAGFAYLTRRLANVKDTLDLTWFGAYGYPTTQDYPTLLRAEMAYSIIDADHSQALNILTSHNAMVKQGISELLQIPDCPSSGHVSTSCINKADRDLVLAWMKL